MESESRAIALTALELEEMLDRAADKGARKALETLGLHDEAAGTDLKELRSFLMAWRDTKNVVWQTIARIITTGVILTMGASLWIYIKGNLGTK